MLCRLANPIVNMIRSSEKGNLMFMIVTYPWPVPSAHVELTGIKSPDATRSCGDTIGQRARDLEDMVCWTDWERLAIKWCRLRLAISDMRRRA